MDLPIWVLEYLTSLKVYEIIAMHLLGNTMDEVVNYTTFKDTNCLNIESATLRCLFEKEAIEFNSLDFQCVFKNLRDSSFQEVKNVNAFLILLECSCHCYEISY